MDHETLCQMFSIPTLQAAIADVTFQRAEFVRDNSDVADIDAWLAVANAVLAEKTDDAQDG